MDLLPHPVGDVDVTSWLAEETRVQRARLERHPRLAALLAPHVTPAEYLDVLARSLGFCAPLELELSRAPHLGAAPSRTPLLARDLRALGLPEAALGGLPVCGTLAPRSSLARVLAGRFVLGTFPLGGPVTLHHLARTLGVTPARGGASYADAAADVRERQTRLGHDVRAFVARGGCLDHLADDAAETFELLHDWLDA